MATLPSLLNIFPIYLSVIPVEDAIAMFWFACAMTVVFYPYDDAYHKKHAYREGVFLGFSLTIVAFTNGSLLFLAFSLILISLFIEAFIMKLADPKVLRLVSGLGFFFLFLFLCFVLFFGPISAYLSQEMLHQHGRGRVITYRDILPEIHFALSNIAIFINIIILFFGLVLFVPGRRKRDNRAYMINILQSILFMVICLFALFTTPIAVLPITITISVFAYSIFYATHNHEGNYINPFFIMIGSYILPLVIIFFGFWGLLRIYLHH